MKVDWWGILRNIISGNKDDSTDDLRMNNERIGNNEAKLRELQATRVRIPRWDVEALDDIDYEIEKCGERLHYLREKREKLHKENYGYNNSEY